MLNLKNINAGYGDRQVLFDISMNLKENDIGLVIGSNGSGKSTLLKVIYGILKPNNGGQVFFDDKLMNGLPPYKMLNGGLAYVPQKDNVFEDLTVKENLEISGNNIQNRDEFYRNRENVLELFPRLKEFFNRTPFNLSGGERQMLAVGMGLMNNPKLMLLDEPCSGLAPSVTHDMLERLKLMNQKMGITLLIVEHRVKETLDISNCLYALKLGKLLLSKQNVSKDLSLINFKSIFS